VLGCDRPRYAAFELPALEAEPHPELKLVWAAQSSASSFDNTIDRPRNSIDCARTSGRIGRTLSNVMTPASRRALVLERGRLAELIGRTLLGLSGGSM
jgi:hypothetical protein